MEERGVDKGKEVVVNYGCFSGVLFEPDNLSKVTNLCLSHNLLAEPPKWVSAMEKLKEIDVSCFKKGLLLDKKTSHFCFSCHSTKSGLWTSLSSPTAHNCTKSICLGTHSSRLRSWKSVTLFCLLSPSCSSTESKKATQTSV